MGSMQAEANLAARRSRRHGVLICAVTLLLALVFVYGLWHGSYWAVALPVALGVFSALWLLFWIGYTISTVRGIPAEAEQYHGASSRYIARGICAGSLLLGMVFVVGVSLQSYWALALPVAAAVLALLGMVFWIGWAIVRQKTTLAAPEGGSGGGDRPA